jgi:hypothetical protein|tara:strand:- start:129 stop:398 length:270 start_codon:yes stop_codon:yes gene_type:complete
MTDISEKDLRRVKHLLFEAMDKQIIDYSITEDVKYIQEQHLISNVIKYVGLEPTATLTQQLRAEYKVWKQQLNTKVQELRDEEKKHLGI